MHRGGAEVASDPYRKEGQHGCTTRVDLKVVQCTTRCPCGGTDREAIHFSYRLCPVCMNPRTRCIARISGMSCGVMSLAIPGDLRHAHYTAPSSTVYTFNLHGLVFCSATIRSDGACPKTHCGLLGVPIC
jgi:hypothetical protein